MQLKYKDTFFFSISILFSLGIFPLFLHYFLSVLKSSLFSFIFHLFHAYILASDAQLLLQNVKGVDIAGGGDEGGQVGGLGGGNEVFLFLEVTIKYMGNLSFFCKSQYDTITNNRVLKIIVAWNLLYPVFVVILHS